MKATKLTLIAALAWSLLAAPCLPRAAFAQEAGDPALKEIRRQIRSLASELSQTKARDSAEIQLLEKRVGQLESENRGLKGAVADTNTQAKTAATQAAQASQAVKQVQAQNEAGPSVSQFAQTYQHYLGSHTFQITGAAAVDFVFDQQSGSIDGFHHASQNSFFLDWEPLFLYRPTDWILFEGELDGGFGQTGTQTDLALADFHLFLNDYAEVVAGLFDQPFGDWYEAQSPIWVNRFISAPLPFGVEPVVPPSELGVQLRGGVQWGKVGQDVDYTTWVGNGPEFTSNVPGAVLGGPVAIANKQTNGKAFGARIRFYPLPVEKDWGRLELGASTYDGKWLNGNWFTSWGVDFNYFWRDWQARGEWLQSYRKMPSGSPVDNRTGWYFQVGYFLRSIEMPSLPVTVSDQVRKLEPLIRYSGVNQRFVATSDIAGATGVGAGGLQVGLIPDFGLSGSPSLFAPHSREVALGLDYWIAPSIVWKNEFDIELPHAGGFLVNSKGALTPAGSIPNDHAFLSRFTVGF